MKVRTEYTGCNYITPGKEYDATPHGANGCLFIDDNGDETFAWLGGKSAHLNHVGKFVVVPE